MTVTAAHAALEAGDADRAADLLRAALRDGLDLEILNDLAVVEHLRGRTDEAEALLRTCLSIDPGRPDAIENLERLNAAPAPGEQAAWRRSSGLGGPEPETPERAFPGMTYTDVMAEHAARYAFAMHVVGGMHVLDLGCGTGYGSEMLTWVADSVRGFDLWSPADDERPVWPGGARLSYGHDLCRDPLPPADAAVAFEVVEHLADAPAALRTAFAAAPGLVTSFPNPVWHGSHHNPHHVNDWTLEEFERELAAAAGARPGVAELVLSHFWQDSGGLIVDGRKPDASYWIVVARLTEPE